jgi:hypothetical protein
VGLCNEVVVDLPIRLALFKYIPLEAAHPNAKQQVESTIMSLVVVPLTYGTRQGQARSLAPALITLGILPPPTKRLYQSRRHSPELGLEHELILGLRSLTDQASVQDARLPLSKHRGLETFQTVVA